MDSGHSDCSSDVIDGGCSTYPKPIEVQLSAQEHEKELKKYMAFTIIGVSAIAAVCLYHKMTTYSVDSARDVQTCISQSYEDNFGAKATENFAERHECDEVTRYVIGSLSNPPSLDSDTLNPKEKALITDKIGKLRDKALNVLIHGKQEVWVKP